MKPFISIIIPTLNEEGYIENCLKSIKRQSYKNYEIIVVDGGSKDNTVKIAKKYADKVLTDRRKGPAIARNVGAKHAKGEILIFSDADVIFPKGSLRKIKKEFKGLGGAVCKLDFYDARKRYCILLDIFSFFVKISHKLGIGMTNGSLFVYRKNLFEKMGGFNEKLLTCEDQDLAIRIGKISRFGMIDVKVLTSSRRIKNFGFWKYFLIYLKMSVFFILKHKSYPKYWTG